MRFPSFSDRFESCVEQRSEGTEVGVERPAGKFLATMCTRHNAPVEVERSRTFKIFFGGRMPGLADRLPSGKQALKSHQQLSLNVNRPFPPRETCNFKRQRRDNPAVGF